MCIPHKRLRCTTLNISLAVHSQPMRNPRHMMSRAHSGSEVKTRSNLNLLQARALGEMRNVPVESPTLAWTIYLPAS